MLFLLESPAGQSLAADPVPEQWQLRDRGRLCLLLCFARVPNLGVLRIELSDHMRFQRVFLQLRDGDTPSQYKALARAGFTGPGSRVLEAL